jgi:hypothetical protein
MSTDNDVARALRSWLTENRHEDAEPRGWRRGSMR